MSVVMEIMKIIFASFCTTEAQTFTELSVEADDHFIWVAIGFRT